MLNNESQKFLTENEAMLASKSGALKSLRIIKKGGDLYLKMRFSWDKDEITITTQRNKNEPKKFKNIDRLISHVEENYPEIMNLTLTIL